MDKSIQATPDRFPMIGNITQKNNNYIESERTLTIEADRYLDDHRFNGVPFLPGVIGLELFTELCKIISPEKTILQFNDVEFRSAIRLKEDKPFTIYTKIASVEEGNLEAIISSNIQKTSEKKPTSKLHFRANIIFGTRKNERQTLPVPNKMPLLTREFIYQILPHGSTLQVLDELNSIENEMIATCKPRKKQIFGWKIKELITEPFSLEAAFQAIGLMDFIFTGRVGLPSKIRQLKYFASEEKPHFIIGKKNTEKDGTYDFTILSKHGEVILKALEYQMVEVNFGDTSSILEKLRSHRIRQLIPVVKKTWLEVIDKQLVLDKLTREPDFITTFLSERELVEVRELNEDDQKNTLVKLFAMKRALRLIFLSRKMKEFSLEKDELGKYCGIFKSKKSYLTLAESSDYILAYASRKRRYGIYFFDKNDEITIKKSELFSTEEVTWFENKKIDLNKAIINHLFIAKKTVLNYFGDNTTLGFKDITICSYSNEIMSFQINQATMPEQKKEINVTFNQNKMYIMSTSSIR